ncbi:MAG: pantetheine-phosphate adenylyltransferase [Oscillospiraceae bacterium]|jgi:pantetheine-phosphate adenylyltransferase|nr:pantetheine-phosphate adenylyltransferase [Oscillospiraceae bacterium]
MTIAVCPGSFDPITLGHLNIIRRASKIFDKVRVCVMVNSDKNPLFSRDERVALIKRCAEKYGNVEVETWDDLLVSYCEKVGATIIVKGLRAVSDFDREFQMALANRKIRQNIETLFMSSGERYQYLSSSIVKEMGRYGADISEFVPREVHADIVQRINERKQSNG